MDKSIKIATQEELIEMVREIEQYGYSWNDPHEINGGCQQYECGKCKEEYCTWCQDVCPACGSSWDDDF